mmetsp:Transcript_2473/g.7242  ORF Transcript_2473/g.7242 Transcript_2473/m.7242 type:complete len:341 (-) Transcript_2473:190-1212(-)
MHPILTESVPVSQYSKPHEFGLEHHIPRLLRSLGGIIVQLLHDLQCRAPLLRGLVCRVLCMPQKLGVNRVTTTPSPRTCAFLSPCLLLAGLFEPGLAISPRLLKGVNRLARAPEFSQAQLHRQLKCFQLTEVRLGFQRGKDCGGGRGVTERPVQVGQDCREVAMAPHQGCSPFGVLDVGPGQLGQPLLPALQRLLQLHDLGEDGAVYCEVITHGSTANPPLGCPPGESPAARAFRLKWCQCRRLLVLTKFCTTWGREGWYRRRRQQPLLELRSICQKSLVQRLGLGRQVAILRRLLVSVPSLGVSAKEDREHVRGANLGMHRCGLEEPLQDLGMGLSAVS